MIYEIKLQFLCILYRMKGLHLQVFLFLLQARYKIKFKVLKTPFSFFNLIISYP